MSVQNMHCNVDTTADLTGKKIVNFYCLFIFVVDGSYEHWSYKNACTL